MNEKDKDKDQDLIPQKDKDLINIINYSKAIVNEEKEGLEENFLKFRKFLNKPNNVLGKAEKNGIRFTRKYIPNVLDPSIRLYYTNIKLIDTINVKLIANVCIVHGFGHYSQEFYEMAYNLAKEGMNCHLIDLRGHGYSGGCRIDWTIEDLHLDVLTLIKQTESDEVDLPIYVFGHSMGGGLITSLFINNQYLQVNGVILSAPLLGIPLNANFDSVKSYFLSKFGNNLREFILTGNINPTELCKDEREVIRLVNDKLILPLASPRAFRSLIKNCERILENSR
jgi:acylglycerol lipase